MAKGFIRLTCPFCGSMPYPEQAKKSSEKYGAEVHVILMTVGGKAPADEQDPGGYKKQGKGSAKGSITYEDVTAEHPDIVAEFNQWFAERAIKFAEQAGFIE